MAHLIHIGVGTHVAALRPEDGSEVWRTKLGSSWGGGFVTLALVGDRLLAGLHGEVHCLDSATGALLWHNTLRGCGHGFVSFAGTEPGGAAASASAEQANAAAMVAAVAAATAAGS